MNHAIYSFFFYRVKNDSNDDCRYGAFKDGDNCKGNLEKRNPSQPCEYSHKRQHSNSFLRTYVEKKYMHSISCNFNVVTHRLSCWIYWRQLL